MISDYRKQSIFLLIIVCLAACKDIYQFPDKSKPQFQTKILGHRGGGGEDFLPNSFQAVKNGFKYLSGVEVDIQLSKDGTLWIAHDNQLEPCENLDYKCFTGSTDKEIEALVKCENGKVGYLKLEVILEFMSKNYPEKHISLDIKSPNPCGISSLNITKNYSIISERVIALAEKFNLSNRILVESRNVSFLKEIIEKGDGIAAFIIGHSKFENKVEKALRNELDGVSFKFNPDTEIDIALANQKGLKIQLWTVNEKENIEQAYNLNPDFIQTDNVDLFR